MSLNHDCSAGLVGVTEGQHTHTQRQRKTDRRKGIASWLSDHTVDWTSHDQAQMHTNTHAHRHTDSQTVCLFDPAAFGLSAVFVN